MNCTRDDSMTVALGETARERAARELFDCAATCVVALIGADCIRCTNLSFATFSLVHLANTLLRLLLVLHLRAVSVS